jgi:Domain of unknown function (DUF4157)
MQAQLSARRTALEPPVPTQAPQTVPGHDDAAALRPSAVPVLPGHAPRRCSCGGIIGPTGECSACRARRLLAQAGPDSEDKAAALLTPVALGVDGAWLGRQLGSGSKLTPGVRREMEDSFGVAFAHVRIHTDPRGRSRAARGC